MLPPPPKAAVALFYRATPPFYTLPQECTSKTIGSGRVPLLLLLLLLPTLSISQLAANSLLQPLGPWQGCSSSEPAPSPGFLCSRQDGGGDFPSSVARPPPFSRFPCDPAPQLRPCPPACHHPAILPALAQPCPALPEGFYPRCHTSPWEGRGGLGRRGSAFQHQQWGIRRLSTVIKYCLHCLLTER